MLHRQTETWRGWMYFFHSCSDSNKPWRAAAAAQCRKALMAARLGITSIPNPPSRWPAWLMFSNNQPWHFEIGNVASGLDMCLPWLAFQFLMVLTLNWHFRSPGGFQLITSLRGASLVLRPSPTLMNNHYLKNVKEKFSAVSIWGWGLLCCLRVRFWKYITKI